MCKNCKKIYKNYLKADTKAWIQYKRRTAVFEQARKMMEEPLNTSYHAAIRKIQDHYIKATEPYKKQYDKERDALILKYGLKQKGCKEPSVKCY